MTMDCWECNENPGEKIDVEYTDGKTGTVLLCDRCQDQFEEVGFVVEIRPLSAE